MKNIISILLFTLVSFASLAQTSITGTVVSQKSEPVAGAVVMTDKTNAVVTDMDGNFTIKISSAGKAELTVSCLGFRTKTVPASSAKQIVLEEDFEMLDEVVMVGYGSMRRSDLTGAVSSVKIDEDNAARSSSLDQMIEGRVAGVQILNDSASPDAGLTVRVRGLGSFSGNTDPLYVLDGVIINGQSEVVSTMSIGYSNNAKESTNPLSGINPQDIASIEILKDASATAIYGSQGANGVVLITTKQADKDRPKIDFNAGVTVSTAGKKLDVMDFDQYVEYLKMYPGSAGTSAYNSLLVDPADPSKGYRVTPVDWQDYIMRTGVSQRYYFSISGKNKVFNYLFSTGFNHDEGVLRKNDSNIGTVRLNLTTNFSEKFKLKFNSNLGYTKSNLLTGAVIGGNVTSRSSILRSILRSRPFIYKNPTAEEIDEDETEADEELRFNPQRWVEGSTNTSQRVRIGVALKAMWDILPWLNFTSTIGGNLNTDERIKTKKANLSVGYGNIAGVGDSESASFNFDNTLNFNKTWGKHTLNATLGQSCSGYFSKVFSVSGEHLPSADALDATMNLAKPEYVNYETYSYAQNTLLSFFGRAVYNYNNCHMLTATFRADGSSKFRGTNKWGFFPSFAYAWRIAEESWFNVPVISNLKLRLGWGQVGNQATRNYQTEPTFGSSYYGSHFAPTGSVLALYQSNIPNPDLKWETTSQLNGGIDLSLWRGRFTLTLDVYNKDTRDLLQSKNIAITSGITTLDINDGSINNKGIEFAIEAVPVQWGDFEWTIGGNMSFNRNTIMSVGESGNSGKLCLDGSTYTQVNYFNGDMLQSSGDTNALNIFVEGQPMGLFYGYVTDGIVQSGETAPGFEQGKVIEEGCVRYKDINGNGWIDPDDRTIIGNPHPKFNYGFNTALSIKWFTLKLDFIGSYGFDIFNFNNVQDYATSSNKNSRVDAAFGAWTPENCSNVWPKLGIVADSQLSDRYVEDGSYLRLSNVSLSFAAPINRKKSKVVKSLSVGLSAGNLAVWTKYSGFTPFSNSYGSNVKRMGVDLNSAPYPRSLSFDLKIGF